MFLGIGFERLGGDFAQSSVQPCFVETIDDVAHQVIEPPARTRIRDGGHCPDPAGKGSVQSMLATLDEKRWSVSAGFMELTIERGLTKEPA